RLPATPDCRPPANPAETRAKWFHAWAHPAALLTFRGGRCPANNVHYRATTGHRQGSHRSGGPRRLPLQPPGLRLINVVASGVLFPDSSMVEQPAVNRFVVGSSPTRGAASKAFRTRKLGVPIRVGWCGPKVLGTR